MKAPSQRPFLVTYILSQIRTYLTPLLSTFWCYTFVCLRYLVALSVSILFPGPNISKNNRFSRKTEIDVKRNHLVLMQSGKKKKKTWFKETRAPITPAANTNLIWNGSPSRCTPRNPLQHPGCRDGSNLRVSRPIWRQAHERSRSAWTFGFLGCTGSWARDIGLSPD